MAAASRDDWMELKEKLKRQASSLGIDKIGFTSARPFQGLKDILVQHRQKGYESGFEEQDLDKRVDPSQSLGEAQSIISIAIAYPSKLSPAPKSEKDHYRGMIARSAWGQDYHHVLKKRLVALQSVLEQEVSDVKTELMVDTGALVDRSVAERAGIGWSGKNCSIISPEFGSWIYLGEMITNIPFPPDVPMTEQCGSCNKCIEACPTDALVGPGQLNAQRCISFLTQTKDVIDDFYKKKIGNRLYGCDTCQIVCPINKGKHFTHQEELLPEPELAKPLLKPLLSMSNKQFKQKFGHTAAAWRGKKPIQRNAIIALGHFKDQSALPDLMPILLRDEREVMRESAAWSLGQIGGAEAESVLHQASEKEESEVVLDAIHKALQNILSTAEENHNRIES
ncbi:tRNA epoxyqueuosine(34) reductase QueG [Longirhabdus pacifica]|uniref:tRNA epoxyqueuosine(34) reductase QueG n=1 Tax=Longirhabdus pacifica TaxID=2305227 RepID=UPI001008F84E|nr:tRNA epoxyqueuosine(34) reductase QueG [Longirhabdus pacifica]